MPDTQKFIDRCGQMLGAGAAAGKSPQKLNSEITHSGRPSAALKDHLFVCGTVFLKGQKSTLTKYDSGAHCTTAACTCLLHPPQIRQGLVTASLFPEKRWNPQGCKESDKETLRCTRAKFHVSHSLCTDSILICLLWE